MPCLSIQQQEIFLVRIKHKSTKLKQFFLDIIVNWKKLVHQVLVKRTYLLTNAMK